MKKRIYGLTNIVLLSLIIFLGIVLRSFHVDFPSIGYHNMIENEYLTIAQEMRETNDYSPDKTFRYNIFKEPSGKGYSQPPLLSYHILLAWKLLDENLWGPRLLNVLFGALSILVIYFIASILLKDPILSLSCSLLLAIMPLAVFFSRNLQPESPAFFFMILANLFYLRFISSFKQYNLFFSGLSLSVACLYQFNFFIAVIPFIFCFPFKTYLKRKGEFLKTLLVSCLSISPIVIFLLWLRYQNMWDLSPMNDIKLFRIFTADYWTGHGRMIWWYTKRENFTIIYTILALLGIIIAFLRKKILLNRYIIGWGTAIIIYAMIYPENIYQNSFFQMPFLALVCISSVYAISSASRLIKRYLARDLFLLLMSITILISVPFAYNSILRMHETVFLGVDVAGGSLREFTQPGECVFLSSHIQGYGIIRYSRRPAGWVDNLEEFKAREKEFNINYACFYPLENLFRLRSTNLPLFEYLKENYHIKEVGLTDEPFRLYYIILTRGKGPDFEESLKSLSGIKRTKSIYQSFDRYIFFYSLRPVITDSEDTG